MKKSEKIQKIISILEKNGIKDQDWQVKIFNKLHDASNKKIDFLLRFNERYGNKV